MAAVAQQGPLDAPVPGCPGWDLGRPRGAPRTGAPVGHGGRHHRCRTDQSTIERPPRGPEVVEWYEAGIAPLVDALRATGDGPGGWNFMGVPDPAGTLLGAATGDRDVDPPVGRRRRRRRRRRGRAARRAAGVGRRRRAPVPVDALCARRQGRHRHRRVAARPLHRCRRRVDAQDRRRRAARRPRPRQGRRRAARAGLVAVAGVVAAAAARARERPRCWATVPCSTAGWRSTRRSVRPRRRRRPSHSTPASPTNAARPRCASWWAGSSSGTTG